MLTSELDRLTKELYQGSKQRVEEILTNFEAILAEMLTCQGINVDPGIERSILEAKVAIVRIRSGNEAGAKRDYEKIDKLRLALALTLA